MKRRALRWLMAIGLTVGVLMSAFGPRARPRRRPPTPRIAPAEVEAAVRAVSRELLGGENDRVERALLAWIDLESGFDSTAVAVARTGRAWGLFQLLDRFFLPLAIERGLLPPDALPEDLAIPVVNIRLGTQNTIELLQHRDNPGEDFTSTFVAARSRALGCDWRCTCSPDTCERLRRRALEALSRWELA